MLGFDWVLESRCVPVRRCVELIFVVSLAIELGSELLRDIMFLESKCWPFVEGPFGKRKLLSSLSLCHNQPIG